MKKFLLFIAGAFLMSGCHKIHEGNVSEKFIIPAHPYRYFTTVIIGKSTMFIWHNGYVDTKYVLKIKNGSITENFSVPYSIYNCKNIGDYFNGTIPCSVWKEQ